MRPTNLRRAQSIHKHSYRTGHLSLSLSLSSPLGQCTRRCIRFGVCNCKFMHCDVNMANISAAAAQSPELRRVETETETETETENRGRIDIDIEIEIDSEIEKHNKAAQQLADFCIICSILSGGGGVTLIVIAIVTVSVTVTVTVNVSV